MTKERWAILRKRVYLTLPAVQSLLVIYGVTSDSVAALWVSIVGILLTGQGYVLAAKYVDVSRETFTPESTPSVSRETITAPCAVMHGTGEPHVLGCDGWTFDPT